MKDGFTVKLARQNTSVFVPSDGSILYTLLNAGIDVPYSCGSGMCGTCEQEVLSGMPEHRDFPQRRRKGIRQIHHDLLFRISYTGTGTGSSGLVNRNANCQGCGFLDEWVR